MSDRPMSAASSAPYPGGAQLRRSLLEGVRVLDLTKATSGPFATQILADLGAEVIKIEEPPGPMGRPPVDPDHQLFGMDASFLAVNRGKKSLAVKLASDEGRAIVYELAKTCDVVVDNFRPGVAEKLGVDPASLRAVKPNLITCSLTGFGRSGSLADRAAYDITTQGETAAMAFIGKRDADGRLTPIPMPIGDLVAGMYCAVAIPAALFRLSRTGEGEHLEVSMFDSLVAWLVGYGVHFLNFGERWGFTDTAIWRTFDTADRPLVVAAHRPAQWKRLCHALERVEWLTDPRFESIKGRVDNADELMRLISERMSTAAAAVWEQRLDAAGVAYARCVEMHELLTEGYAFERGMIVDLDTSDRGRMRLLGNPIATESESDQTTPPPLHGEHTREVLAQIGMSAGDIEALEAAGVVHCGEGAESRAEGTE